ncbi:MAG TPA: hypothetical protein DCQ32_00940, partial [Cyanobacteria bacterium UBA8156]|nr:hypothetical protein [Cyanobacteria bacterium UBA8156]
MENHPTNHQEKPGWLARRSLRDLLVLPLAVALPVAIGAIGYVTYTSAAQSVTVLGNRLLTETALRVNQHLNQYLTLPHQITELNLNAVDQGLISPTDLTTMGRVFWAQQQIFQVSYVNFGGVNREFIGAGVNPGGKVTIDEVRSPNLETLVSYTADALGNRLTVDETIPVNPVDSEWYTEAVQWQEPRWTSIYAWNDDRRVLAISASAPYVDRQGKFRGVFGVDLLLEDIARFLGSLDVSPNGRVFVMEPSGLLVASSGSLPVYQLQSEGQGQAAIRLAVTDYGDPLIRGTGQLLAARYPDWENIVAPAQFQGQVAGETVLVRVTPFADPYGLNWLAVVVVPARDLQGSIPQIWAVAVVVGSLTTGLAVGLGWAIAGRIARPLRRLSQASAAMAAGHWEQTVPLAGTIEIRALAGAYNQMAHQLKTAFGELEQRVAERTQALVRNERRLRQLNQALRELSGQAVLYQGERRPAYRIITETAAHALEVERSSLWFYDVGSTKLVCETLYERSYHLTSWGWELRAADYPALWAAIAQESLVSIEDAAVDARTCDEAVSYFRPLGITSVVFLPVQHRKQRLGFLMLEHQGTPRAWLEEELGFARSLTDLTALAIAAAERRQVEQALKEAKEAAEAANAAKSDFLSNMSHELRTPLNGILGYAQILQRDGGLNEEQRAGLNTIHRCGHHLLNLINDVLDFAKIEAQKLELEATAFHLGLCLDSLLEMCRLRAEQKGLTLRYVPDPQLPVAICSDEKRLRQVLLNLLGNAIKFTEVGEVSLAVTVTALGDRRCTLRFAVTDTGVGIPADRLAAIFLPFEQTEIGRRKGEGTGLGLAISQRCVEMLGGTLQVTSTLGAGSRFWFELSCPLATHWQPPQGSGRERVVGVHGRPPQVLVVDDNPENRAIVVGLLQPLGCVVEQAEHGLAAFARLAANRPDLMILDLVMPVMDGFEVLRRLRSDAHYQDLPVIVSSASVSAQDRASSLAAGSNAFLPKPIDSDELFQVMEQLLPLTWLREQPSLPPSPLP